MRGWGVASRQGQLDLGEGGYTPQGAMSLAEEIAVLRKQNKDLTRANKRLQEDNEFLSEASAFLPRAVGSQQKREIKVHNKGSAN